MLNSCTSSLKHNDASQIRIVPHLDSPRSLVFGVIERELRQGLVLKMGRFTDKYYVPSHITFKSKVVSRGHAELWADREGKVYLRDTKSSSGTFLNHSRLSPPNQESQAVLLHDGDIIQLGVDYQGGVEDIYRCVKMRLEINRSRKQLNAFSLRHMRIPSEDFVQVEDCCICLYAVAPSQALFVAPCSHSFHYKCARPLLQNHPGFQCPICRSYADLEASVAVEASEVMDMLTVARLENTEDLASSHSCRGCDSRGKNAQEHKKAAVGVN
ncbi:hypothetical protein DFQ28_002173 [Apophysomyces sp. BC1034]|nr:hypothetical protein DFQ30_001862 [Apophysomyces sp. BC1015]KAG0180493.1 hypothetical protein DFQ29_000582 [Apophysomyces sp. BC1021]KAG0190358.1 hypothetical protein DFQ28_002173 [Apophysomyces sp. BC1034]